MATIQDITQAAYYRGDPNLGGGGAVPVTVDLQAWQKLADYSYLQGKELYDEKLKRFNDAATQAAASMKVDWSKIPDKWRNQIMEEVRQLGDFLRKNPSAPSRLDAGDEAFFEFQERSNRLNNLVSAGTQRGIEIAAAEKQIAEQALNKTTYDSAKQAILNSLDDDIFKPINPFPKYSFKPVDLSVAATKISSDTVDGDFIFTNEYEGMDFSKLMNRVSRLSVDMNTYSVEYQEMKAMEATANAFNELVSNGFLQEKDASGNPKNVIMSEDGKSFLGFTKSALSDPTFGRILSSINSYMGDYERFVLAGGGPGLAINPMDGLGADEVKATLVYLKNVAAAKKTAKYTGAQTQKDQIAAQERIARRANESRERIAKKANEFKTPGGFNPKDWFGLISNNTDFVPVTEMVGEELVLQYFQKTVARMIGPDLAAEDFTNRVQAKVDGEFVIIAAQDANNQTKTAKIHKEFFNTSINTLFAEREYRILKDMQNNTQNPRTSSNPGGWGENEVPE